MKKIEIGLEWNSLVFYVLTEIPPFVPPIEIGIGSYSVMLPSGRYVEYREATVKIREGFDLTYLRWMYKRLRSEMGLGKKKGLTVKHLQLYRLVKQKGEIPRGKGTVAFWRSVLETWNKSNTENKYEGWKGVKIAYERINNKLSINRSNNIKTIVKQRGIR